MNMKVSTVTSGGVNISVDLDELRIINNALNEVCNAFDRVEFSTRMGATQEGVDGLRLQILNLLNTIDKE